jgi:hypothetical protein
MSNNTNGVTSHYVDVSEKAEEDMNGTQLREDLKFGQYEISGENRNM